MAVLKTKKIQPLYSHWERIEDKALRRILLDFSVWCREGKIIIDKNGHAVPFILNEAQLETAKLILPFMFAPVPEPVTLVIHKSRQMGISVLLSAIEQYVVSRKKNLNIVHLLPDEALANEFFNTKWMPLAEGTAPQLLPDMHWSTTPVPYIKVRDFLNHSMNSNIKIGGAGSSAAGRSGTNHVVLMDEYAYYEKVSNLERGVLATQPKTGMTLTVYVSTANGMNHFYDVVQKAKQPSSRLKFLFLPWHMLKEYEREPDENSRFYNLDNYKPTEYDMKLMDIFETKKYPKDSWLKKLAFYDYTLETEAKGDQDYMFENYPSDEGESFEATGRPVLPAKAVTYWMKQEHKFIYIDQYAEMIGGRPVVSMKPTSHSSIKQYSPPQHGRRYMLACDPSSGDYAGDRSAGVVVDLSTLEEVCSFADYVEQTELAEMLVNIAKYYNNATIVVERNMGDTCIQFIRQMNYPRLYIDYAATTRSQTKYGVRTTVATKNEALKRLRWLLNKGLYKPHDKAFLEEALHFSWKLLPGGSYRAEATGTDENGQPIHDDCVAARWVLMLALPLSKFKGYLQPEQRSAIIRSNGKQGEL